MESLDQNWRNLENTEGCSPSQWPWFSHPFSLGIQSDHSRQVFIFFFSLSSPANKIMSCQDRRQLPFGNPRGDVKNCQEVSSSDSQALWGQNSFKESFCDVKFISSPELMITGMKEPTTQSVLIVLLESFRGRSGTYMSWSVPAMLDSSSHLSFIILLGCGIIILILHRRVWAPPKLLAQHCPQFRIGGTRIWPGPLCKV